MDQVGAVVSARDIGVSMIATLLCLPFETTPWR